MANDSGRDISKDYGMRSVLFENYAEMMSTVSKKAVFDVRPEPDSEFEQPYLADDYADQQQIHQANYHPFLTSRDMGIRADNPTGSWGSGDRKGNAFLDAKALINGNLIDMPNTVSFGTEVLLYMDGYDWSGKPWNQDEIKWVVLGPVHGKVVGRKYIATDEDATSDISDNIMGFVGGAGGEFSNIIIKTYAKFNVISDHVVDGGAPIDSYSYFRLTGGATPYKFVSMIISTEDDNLNNGQLTQEGNVYHNTFPTAATTTQTTATVIDANDKYLIASCV